VWVINGKKTMPEKLKRKAIPFPFFHLIYHQLLSKINHLAASIADSESKELDGMHRGKNTAV
jgi:hypothetical protein